MISYEEYKNTYKTFYPSSYKCFMCGGPNAIYQGGDSRFYYSACEKCYGIPDSYERFKQQQKEREEKTKEILERTRIHKFDNEVHKYEY